MSEDQRFRNPEINAVLRGGPGAGKPVTVVGGWTVIGFLNDDKTEVSIYRPSGNPDEEHRTLMRYEFEVTLPIALS